MSYNNIKDGDMRFKDNLRKQRTKAGFSQESLAEEMSVSRQTISKWENGNTYPSTGHILELAKILGCSVDEFVDDEPRNSSQDEDAAGSIQVMPRRRYLYLAAVAAMVLLVFGFLIFGGSRVSNDSRIDNSKIAVFDKIIDGSIDDLILTDKYTKKKIIGYGIAETDGSFYIKCDLEGGEASPCSAIIYFCENDGKYSYKCQYLEDPDYLPSGEYYKVG